MIQISKPSSPTCFVHMFWNYGRHNHCNSNGIYDFDIHTSKMATTFRKPRTLNKHRYWKYNSRREQKHSSNMTATRLIFISNFRLLVQWFCQILTNFIVVMDLNIIFPQACAKFCFFQFVNWFLRFTVSIQLLLCVLFNMPCLTGIVCTSAIVNCSFFKSKQKKLLHALTVTVVTRVTNAR